jgi:hypothetical protein
MPGSQGPGFLSLAGCCAFIMREHMTLETGDAEAAAGPNVSQRDQPVGHRSLFGESYGLDNWAYLVIYG